MIILIILLIILIPLTLFIIFVKKLNGLKEVSIILGSILLVICGLFYLLEDSDPVTINQKLSEANLYLNDNFAITNEQNEQSLIDYYESYEIIISENDKNKLIRQIKKAKKFKSIAEEDLNNYWRDEYAVELIGQQLVRSYNIKQNYYKHISFPGKSRTIEIKIDSLTNELQLTDSAD